MISQHVFMKLFLAALPASMPSHHETLCGNRGDERGAFLPVQTKERMSYVPRN
jgi:hypothetical protein